MAQGWEIPLPQSAVYTAPKMDYSRLAELTQQYASPGIKKLRQGLREALVGSQGEVNPVVGAIKAREALSGFGGGIGEALTAGGKMAADIYAPEFAAQAEAGKASWLENALRERLKWQSDIETAYNQYALGRQLSSQEDIAKKSRQRQDIGFGLQGAGLLTQLLAAYMGEKGADRRLKSQQTWESGKSPWANAYMNKLFGGRDWNIGIGLPRSGGGGSDPYPQFSFNIEKTW